MLPQADAESNFSNLGEGEGLKQSPIAKDCAAVVQWRLVIHLIIYELSNGNWRDCVWVWAR